MNRKNAITKNDEPVGLGGKQVLAPPASNPAEKPVKVNVSDLYGEKGGLVLEAPTREKPAAEPEAPEAIAEPIEEKTDE